MVKSVVSNVSSGTQLQISFPQASDNADVELMMELLQKNQEVDGRGDHVFKMGLGKRKDQLVIL